MEEKLLQNELKVEFEPTCFILVAIKNNSNFKWLWEQNEVKKPDWTGFICLCNQFLACGSQGEFS